MLRITHPHRAVIPHSVGARTTMVLSKTGRDAAIIYDV